MHNNKKQESVQSIGSCYEHRCNIIQEFSVLVRLILVEYITLMICTKEQNWIVNSVSWNSKVSDIVHAMYTQEASNGYS